MELTDSVRTSPNQDGIQCVLIGQELFTPHEATAFAFKILEQAHHAAYINGRDETYRLTPYKADN